MRKTGVVLLALALGLMTTPPASAAVASYSWDQVCVGNQLSTCASVTLNFNGDGNQITLTVENLTGSDVLHSIALGGPGVSTLGRGFLSPSLPYGSDWGLSLTDGNLVLNSATGIAAGGSATFSFTFGQVPGDFETFVASLNGVTVGGNETDGIVEGGDIQPPPEDVGTTTAPEPTSLLLLGTGLAGIAAARRRRREGIEQD